MKKAYHHIDYRSLENVLQDPLWYLVLQDELKTYFSSPTTAEKKEPDWGNIREEYIRFFANALEQGTIALGTSGKNWDEERTSIDTVIIHHTSRAATESLFFLEALLLLRLYVPIYSNPEHSEYQKPIYSNHTYNGRQTFIGYHYLIHPDGSVDHVLDDSIVGWQSGSWELNCRSIAIGFHDELEEKRPTAAALASAKRIIKKYIGANVIGHKEVKGHTRCPGDMFEEWIHHLRYT